jgi:hypothetical protein
MKSVWLADSFVPAIIITRTDPTKIAYANWKIRLDTYLR